MRLRLVVARIVRGAISAGDVDGGCSDLALTTIVSARRSPNRRRNSVKAMSRIAGVQQMSNRFSTNSRISRNRLLENPQGRSDD